MPATIMPISLLECDYRLSALTPRNLMKHASHFQVMHDLLPHLLPMEQSVSTASCPNLSALAIKAASSDCRILPIMLEIVADSTELRTFCTHFIVRSKMALSTLDSSRNHAFVRKALDLIFTRSCLVVNATAFPSSH